MIRAKSWEFRLGTAHDIMVWLAFLKLPLWTQVEPFIQHSNLQSIFETNIDLKKNASRRWSFSEELDLPRRISEYNDWRVDPVEAFCDFQKGIPPEEDPIGRRSSFFPAGFGERYDWSQPDWSTS
jgi:hypothetical protein